MASSSVNFCRKTRTVHRQSRLPLAFLQTLPSTARTLQGLRYQMGRLQYALCEVSMEEGGGGGGGGGGGQDLNSKSQAWVW
jgi:hypothetical protein